MADIYTKARGVIVWLGSERDGSALAMKALDTVGSEIQVDWPTLDMTPLIGEEYDDWRKRPLPFASNQDVIDSITCLLNRTWFTRLWIWQEIRLANSGAEIRCGYDSMSWDHFRNAVLCLRTKRLPEKNKFDVGVDQSFPIVDYDGTNESWYDILNQTRGCQCSDARDRIFANLNLVRPVDRSGIEPDYSKSTSEVYKGLILHNLNLMQDLSDLTNCELGENKVEDLPSWVPDFTKRRKCKTLWDFRASSTSRARAVVHNETSLVTAGCCVGTNHTIEAISFWDDPGVSLQAGATCLIKPKLKQNNYTAGGSMVEALCRTLCCNVFSERVVPPLQGAPDFKKSKEYLLEIRDSKEPTAYLHYIAAVFEAVKGRVFFVTKEGYIGLAPAAIKPQDQICIPLGCPTPLVLRLDGPDNYKVVGECYIHGMMDGAAFLGPMPRDWRCVVRYFPQLKNYVWAWVNDATGEIRLEDPRFGALPPGWRVASHKYEQVVNLFSNDETGEVDVVFDPRMSPEALKERGVELQDFRLV